MNRAAGAALFALLAFAANSVLCRMALRQTHIDPASFTSIRLVAGAITLWILVQASSKRRAPGGSWPSAFALLAYAIAFSLDRKSTRLNSSHSQISYAVFCLKK